jgi:hypothetical protein
MTERNRKNTEGRERTRLTWARQRGWGKRILQQAHCVLHFLWHGCDRYVKEKTQHRPLMLTWNNGLVYNTVALTPEWKRRKENTGFQIREFFSLIYVSDNSLPEGTLARCSESDCTLTSDQQSSRPRLTIDILDSHVMCRSMLWSIIPGKKKH